MKYTTLEEYRNANNIRQKRYLGNLTEAEKITYKENRRVWLSKQPLEVQQRYMEHMKSLLHKHCDVCNKDCTNIYSHSKSKKHQLNIGKSDKSSEL